MKNIYFQFFIGMDYPTVCLLQHMKKLWQCVNVCPFSIPWATMKVWILQFVLVPLCHVWIKFWVILAHILMLKIKMEIVNNVIHLVLIKWVVHIRIFSSKIICTLGKNYYNCFCWHSISCCTIATTKKSHSFIILPFLQFLHITHIHIGVKSEKIFFLIL